MAASARRQAIRYLCALVLVLAAGCGVTDESRPSQRVRVLASSFSMPGYERTDEIEWTGNGARLVLNFRGSLDSKSPCVVLQEAIERLPQWKYRELRGIPMGYSDCYWEGFTGKTLVTAGADANGTPTAYIGFWN